MKLTKRQEEYLKLIVEDFIENGEPIGSHNFISKNKLDISSATVRNEMSYLEQSGLLYKESSSAGRVPSTKGYEYYVKNLISNRDEKEMEYRLKTIFAKRTIGIDLTIDEAVEKISEVTGLTLITSDRQGDELLKAIQLIPISASAATIIIVTSSGRVESQTISINPTIKINDLKVAIRLFQERLIDTPLNNLQKQAILLKELLKEKISNFEVVLQEFVTKIFDFHLNKKQHIYGEANIIKRTDISREDLIKIISLLEKKSIWDSLEAQTDEDNKLRISIGKDNTSIVSKKLETDSGSKEVSIVGSHRLDYSRAITILKLLEKFLKSK